MAQTPFVRSEAFAATRRENDAAFLGRIEEIRAGAPLDVLERFAKAYLGLYFQVDNALAPWARIHELAHDELAQAVLEGFAAGIAIHTPPTPEHIASSPDHETNALAFVTLAALDRFATQDIERLLALPRATLRAALCFSLRHDSYHHDHWIAPLIEHQPHTVAEALKRYWGACIKTGTRCLPGFTLAFGETGHLSIALELVQPLLAQWRDCDHRTLRTLLSFALRYTDHTSLRPIVHDALKTTPPTQPVRQTYWLAGAFMLDPITHAQTLASFAGRSKEKLAPLLDFVLQVLAPGTPGPALKPDPVTLTHLLRIIAPAFPPQENHHGVLSDDTQDVLTLFYILDGLDGGEIANPLRELRRVRVMGPYRGVLDYIAAGPHGHGASTDRAAFIARMQRERCLSSRRTWFSREP